MRRRALAIGCAHLDGVAGPLVEYFAGVAVLSLLYWIALVVASRISFLTPRKRDIFAVSAIAAGLVQLQVFAAPWLGRFSRVQVALIADVVVFAISLALLRHLAGLPTISALRVGSIGALLFTLANVALVGIR